MISRRNVLLAGIGLAGIAAYARNLFALGAHAGVEKFEVLKESEFYVVDAICAYGILSFNFVSYPAFAR